jgi:hypothetical protein
MYTMQVLNDANEWELVAQLFASEAEAEAFFYAELDCFADFVIVKMQQHRSEDDVKGMCRANDLLITEADEDWDECADPDAALDDFNYVGSRYHY